MSQVADETVSMLESCLTPQQLYLGSAHWQLGWEGPLSFPLDGFEPGQGLGIRVQRNGILLHVGKILLLCLQLGKDLTPAGQLHTHSMLSEATLGGGEEEEERQGQQNITSWCSWRCPSQSCMHAVVQWVAIMIHVHLIMSNDVTE